MFTDSGGIIMCSFRIKLSRVNLWLYRRSASACQLRSWSSAVTEIIPCAPRTKRAPRRWIISSLSASSLMVVSQMAPQYSNLDLTRDIYPNSSNLYGQPLKLRWRKLNLWLALVDISVMWAFHWEERVPYLSGNKTPRYLASLTLEMTSRSE